MTQATNPSPWRVLLPPMLGAGELPDVETAAAFKRAIADPAVTRLIGLCAGELGQLVREGAAEHFAHACVQGSATGDTTPVQWLEVQLGMLRAEVNLARKERAVAAERRHAERDASKPLFEAVNAMSRAATAERESLLARLQTRASGAPRKSRWTELRAAGLSDEEISRLELRDEDAEEARQANQWRERIATLDAQLAKCRAYYDDPLHDPEHVRGLGFDNLVDAQLAQAASAA